MKIEADLHSQDSDSLITKSIRSYRTLCFLGLLLVSHFTPIQENTPLRVLNFAFLSLLLMLFLQKLMEVSLKATCRSIGLHTTLENAL